MGNDLPRAPPPIIEMIRMRGSFAGAETIRFANGIQVSIRKLSADVEEQL